MGENFLLACWHDAGYVGKSIIVMLIVISLYSWSIILVKWQGLRQARSDSQKFIDRFRTNRRNLFHLYPKLNSFRRCPTTEIYKLACQQIYPNVPSEVAENPAAADKPVGSKLNRNRAETIGDNLSTVVSSQATVLEKQMVFLATAAEIRKLLEE